MYTLFSKTDNFSVFINEVPLPDRGKRWWSRILGRQMFFKHWDSITRLLKMKRRWSVWLVSAYAGSRQRFLNIHLPRISWSPLHVSCEFPFPSTIRDSNHLLHIFNILTISRNLWSLSPGHVTNSRCFRFINFSSNAENPSPDKLLLLVIINRVGLFPRIFKTFT